MGSHLFAYFHMNICAFRQHKSYKASLNATVDITQPPESIVYRPIDSWKTKALLVGKKNLNLICLRILKKQYIVWQVRAWHRNYNDIFWDLLWKSLDILFSDFESFFFCLEGDGTYVSWAERAAMIWLLVTGQCCLFPHCPCPRLSEFHAELTGH